jgi:hypothetical protein
MRRLIACIVSLAGLPGWACGQELPGVIVNLPVPMQGYSSSQFAAEVLPPPNGNFIVGGTILTPDPLQQPNTFSAPNTFQPPGAFQAPNANSPPMQPSTPAGAEPAAPANTDIKFDWLPTDNLFNYSWIDFGEGHGLRIHRLEWTNGWTDMRAPDFFSRPTDAANHFQAGLSFAVQWWKERPRPDPWPYGASIPPPVLYDLYLDLDWRAQVASGIVLDLALSPGFSTDFRVTPPDGFRLRGHAISMIDMLPNLRGVLGVWYLNRNTTKVLPVAGLVWQASDATRIEAVFPQPRIVRQLGCWKDRTWEWTVGGEFGGGGWAFKNPEGSRETINYDDFRLVTGLNWVGKHGGGWIEFGYIFQRELKYAQHQDWNYDPGNAIMVRVGWAY